MQAPTVSTPSTAPETQPIRPFCFRDLHTPALFSVKVDVRLIAACLMCVWGSTPCAARDLAEVLRSVESRYNSARTLETQFEQRYVSGGRARRVESGSLKLLKPGKMRWDYTAPAGKLFLSDGKDLWYLSPATGRAEKASMKSADDFRTPLAFLLGRLDFKKTFRDIQLRESGAESAVTAIPKSDRAPYTKVEFTVSASNEITRLLVTGVDETVMEFRFSGEKLNPSLNAGLFRFTPPPGVEVVEVRGFGEAETEK